jgi:TrpR-related protein YerC/YecD
MSEDRLRTREVEELLRALLTVQDEDEVYALLVDLCTVREIQEMAQRLDVAKRLSAGEHYSSIQDATGASATTISRVSKSLHYGADGYNRALERLMRSGSAGRGDAGPAPDAGVSSTSVEGA